MPDLNDELFHRMTKVPTPVTIADPYQDDMPLIFCNQAFEALTGYGADEVIGQNCRFLQHGEAEDELIQQIRDALQDQNGLSIVLRNYRKDGSSFNNLLFLEPLCDRRGNLLLYLGCQYEIVDETTVAELNGHISSLESVVDVAGGAIDRARRTVYQSYQVRSSTALTLAIAQINRSTGAGSKARPRGEM